MPYVKGGTWLGIYKDSPNQDLAWAFLQYCCLNSEAQQSYAAEYGEYVSLKSADEALAAGEGEEVLRRAEPLRLLQRADGQAPGRPYDRLRRDHQHGLPGRHEVLRHGRHDKG